MSTLLKKGDQFIIFGSEGTGRTYFSQSDAMNDLKSYENFKAVNTRFRYTWRQSDGDENYIHIEERLEFNKVVSREIIERISVVEYFRRKLAGELNGTP